MAKLYPATKLNKIYLLARAAIILMQRNKLKIESGNGDMSNILLLTRISLILFYYAHCFNTGRSATDKPWTLIDIKGKKETWVAWQSSILKLFKNDRKI